MFISEFVVWGLNVIFTRFIILLYGIALFDCVCISVYAYKVMHIMLYKTWQRVVVNTFLGMNLECQQYSRVANLILAKLT